MSENEREFLSVLNRRIGAYLPENTKANGAMWAKAAFFFFGYFLTWAALVFANPSIPMAILLCVLLGTLGCGVALNIGHESSHSTFSRHSWVDEALYWISMTAMGVSAQIWKQGHLKTHHWGVNTPGHDVGVEAPGILRINDEMPLRPFHRFQHIYAAGLYCFYSLSWVLFRDWRNLFEGVQASEKIDNSIWRFLEMAVGKALYFAYMLYIPIQYSSFSVAQVLVGFLILHIVFSVYVALQLFTSHLSTEADFGSLDEQGRVSESFVFHHLASTVDVEPKSAIASFLLGGFNTHAIHHLYPNVSSIYYPKMTEILEQTCREFQMPYKSLNLSEAIICHFGYLKRMGHSSRVTEEALSLS